MKKNNAAGTVSQSNTEGIRLFHYALTDSTNKRAREYAQSTDTPELPALFVADGQSEGRGRLGRSFFSPKGTGLYMTLLLPSPKSGEQFARLTSLSAVAVLEAIECRLGVKTQIKWVNDLYLDGKKVAGILAESFEASGIRCVALGVGVNIRTKDFPEFLGLKAGSLLESSQRFDVEQRLELAAQISKRIIKALECEDTGEYMKKYREASCVIGKAIKITKNGSEQHGVALDINGDGALSVLLDSGERVELTSGEISLFVEEGEK